MAELKERLREIRKKHKLTQKDMGTLLNITESAYGYYEQGRNEPSLDALKKIAEKFEVSVSYLSGETDDPTPIDDTYDSLAEINKLVHKYGIEQMGFFDIEEWKNLGPEDIRMLEEQFKLIVKLAKERNEEK
jgi:HTH-type transcriptional regulator, competence development regulator